MDEKITYNGWTNYETWALNLWLENEEGTYNYWRGEASRHRAEASECEQVKAGTWTTEQAAKFNLADALRDDLEAGSPSYGSVRLFGPVKRRPLGSELARGGRRVS